eukprot:1447528-Prymnesium_polylepis.2
MRVCDPAVRPGRTGRHPAPPAPAVAERRPAAACGWHRPQGIRMFVLDEADEMLALGGLGDTTKRIRQKLPKQVQTLFFSATWTESVIKFAKTLAALSENDWSQIEVKRECEPGGRQSKQRRAPVCAPGGATPGGATPGGATPRLCGARFARPTAAPLAAADIFNDQVRQMYYQCKGKKEKEERIADILSTVTIGRESPSPQVAA